MSARRLSGDRRGAGRGTTSLVAFGLGLAVVATSVVLIGTLPDSAGLGWGLLLAGLALVVVLAGRRPRR
jgi:FtsH-binding integral membrane protein